MNSLKDIPNENKDNINFNNLLNVNNQVNKILNNSTELNFEKQDKKNLNIIISFITENKLFFKGYLEKYPELTGEHKEHLGKKTYFINKIDLYINDFFEFLLNNLNIGVIYEPIVSKNEGVKYKETLLRIESKVKSTINHLKLIELFSMFGKEFLIFKYVLFLVFSDLTSNKIKLPLTINLHKQDLLNPELINTIEKYENFFHYNTKEVSGNFYLELIEKSKPLDDTKEILRTFKALNGMGYILVLDDLLNNEQNISQALNEIKELKPSMVKINGGAFNELYDAYIQFYPHVNVLSLKNLFYEIQNVMKIPIIAEKVEKNEIGLLKFLTEILGINLIQGFIFTKNSKNINDYVEGKGLFV